MREPPKIKLPFIALFYLAVAIVSDKLFPSEKILSYNSLGFIVMVLGLSLLIWSGTLFKSHGTPRSPFKIPKTLVLKDPFLYTRNPMYVAMTLVLLGIAVSVGTTIMFFAPIAFIVTIRILFIPYEEDKLEKIFGKEYLDYKKKVRRWV